MKRFSAILAVGLLAAPLSSLATDRAAIEERIEGLVPEVDSLVIAETPVPGVLEVQVNNRVVYMSEDGRYLMQGRLVDLDTQTDLTESAQTEIRRERLADLDTSDMVTFGPEEAEHEIMVFTDTDCGYCRQLHRQIEDYNERGIRVHYLAFPRAGVDSKTYDTMVSVWCADDPQQAMTLAKEGKQPPEAQCENPVEAQYKLGQALGVTGTPALLTPEGRLFPGYVPPAQLLQRLDNLSAE